MDPQVDWKGTEAKLKGIAPTYLYPGLHVYVLLAGTTHGVSLPAGSQVLEDPYSKTSPGSVSRSPDHVPRGSVTSIVP